MRPIFEIEIIHENSRALLKLLSAETFPPALLRSFWTNPRRRIPFKLRQPSSLIAGDSSLLRWSLISSSPATCCQEELPPTVHCSRFSCAPATTKVSPPAAAFVISGKSPSPVLSFPSRVVEMLRKTNIHCMLIPLSSRLISHAYVRCFGGFPVSSGHHRPPSPWWQVVVVKYTAL